MEIMHVYPVNDAMWHELEDDVCVCGPRVELECGTKIVVHASLDGRELDE